MQRLALVRLDALGDTLLTTPAIHMLRQVLPQSEILVLAHSAGAQVLRPLCQVAEVSPEQGWRELGQLLRRFRPDLVLCCSEKRRAALATWASGAPLRVGFQPYWQQPLKALAANLFFHRCAPANPPHLHEAERYASLVELALGPTGLEVPPLQLQPQPQHYQQASAWTHHLGVQLTPKWCRFGYTVQHLRTWLAALDCPWLGLVGPAELEWAQQHFPEVPLYCSRDLLEYAAVLEGLKVFLTIDTGAAHVAAARGVATVDVFPSHNHQHCVPRWRPWRCPHRVVVQPPYSQAAVAEVGLELRQAIASLGGVESPRGNRPR